MSVHLVSQKKPHSKLLLGQWQRPELAFLRLLIGLSVLFCASQTIVAPARADNRNDQDATRQMLQAAKEQQKQAERAQHEAAKQAKELQKQAVRAQHEAAKQAKEQQKQDERDATRQAQQTQNDQGNKTSGNPAVQNQKQPPDDTSDDDNAQRSAPLPSTKAIDSPQKDNRKDEPSGSRKNQKGDKSQNAAEQDVDDAPPATIEQWFKKLASPKKEATKPVLQAKTPVVPTPADAAKVPPKADGAQPEPAKQTVAIPPQARPRSGGNPGPIVLPALPMPEVLAINATRQTIEKAKALGFKATAATSLANLNFSVTSLLAPEGMSASDAQALLQKTVASGSFALNQKYRIYKTASGTESSPTGTVPLKSGSNSAACTTDRCFGRDLIGWKAELNHCVAGVKIGIIDTSVDTEHTAFAHKKLELKHLASAGPTGPDWHGTGVTALLAGDATSSTPGMIPDASFFVADIFHADEDSEPASDTVSMLRAFDWLESKGVNIVNMSLSGPRDDLVRKAIEKLAAKGVLFVAAAGNDGPNAGPSYPAAYEQVIAVTAVNKDQQSYRYANRGSYIDVAAPGVAIWTALPGLKEGYHSGTSFATPFVTASLAALYPQLTAKTKTQVLQQFRYRDLGAPGPDPIYGQGLLIAPATCSGGQVASAPGTVTPAAPYSGSSRLVPASGPAEQLPWLGFQNSGN